MYQCFHFNRNMQMIISSRSCLNFRQKYTLFISIQMFPKQKSFIYFFQKHNEIKNIFDPKRHCVLESLTDKLRRICNEASWNNYLIDLRFSTNILQWLIVSCKFCETVKMHNRYRCHRAWKMSERIRENNLSKFLQSSSSYLNYLTFEKSNFCWLTLNWVIVSSCLMLRMLLNR